MPIVSPDFTWTGGYFGINAGSTIDNGRDFHTAGSVTPGIVVPFQSQHSDGFTGGAQIGYNYEIDGPGLAGLPVVGGRGAAGVVLGVEADAAYLDSRGATDRVGTFGFDARYGGDTTFLGTARGRLGVALGSLLIYGTGGFAYGGVNNSFTLVQPGGTTSFYGQHETIGTGGTYGGGLEYALPRRSFLNVFNASDVTLKGEFLHYDLGTETFRAAGTLAGVNTNFAYTPRVHTEGDVLRVGLNYKFSLVPTAVVARY